MLRHVVRSELQRPSHPVPGAVRASTSCSGPLGVDRGHHRLHHHLRLRLEWSPPRAPPDLEKRQRPSKPTVGRAETAKARPRTSWPTIAPSSPRPGTKANRIVQDARTQAEQVRQATSSPRPRLEAADIAPGLADDAPERATRRPGRRPQEVATSPSTWPRRWSARASTARPSWAWWSATSSELEQK